MNEEFLKVLVCPETRKALAVAESGVIEALNGKIEQGTLLNASGQKVTEKLQGGLMTEGGNVLYPVRNDIPVLLAEESIAL